MGTFGDGGSPGLSAPARAGAAVLVVAASLALAGCTLVGASLPGELPHHAAGGFRNVPEAHGSSAAEFLWDRLRLALATGQPSRAAVLSTDQALTEWRAGAPADAVLWLGHAAVEIRLAGVVAAVDPVFTLDLSPVGLGGPIRLSAPVLDATTMPVANAILVTHNHYDHFEPASIIRLNARAPAICAVPLGLEKGAELGCRSMHALDWGDSASAGALKVTFLQAQHESGRGLFDRNATLWGAYLLEGHGRQVYVTGDTGYGPHFAAAAAQYGPMDLVILSLGGYAPRWINRRMHMNPEEAVQALIDLKAKRALLVHWGTYPLGEEEAADAIEDVLKAADAAGYPRARLMVLRVGGSTAF